MNVTKSHLNNNLTETLAKVLAYGLPILYFLISVAFYLKTYDSAQIKITLIQVGGAALLAVWIVKLLEENSLPFFKNNLIIVAPLIMFLISGIISTIISPLKLASINELYRRIFYIGFALIAVKEFDTNEKIKRLLFWLYASAYVATIYGVIQFLDFRFFPGNPEPGLDPFIWRGAFGPRIFSTFGNPNFYGDFLVVIGPIVLADFLKTRKFHLMLLWLLIAFNVAATGSKGAYLGFAVGLVVFIFIFIGYFVHASRVKVKKVLLGVIGATILFSSVAIFLNLKQRTDSASFRVFTWTSTWEMINTNPVWGTGIGTFYVTYPAWRRPQIFLLEGRHNTETDHPEDEYLEVWYDEGLVGFGIFLWVISVFLFVSFRNLGTFTEGKPDKRAYYQLGIMTALIAQLAHNMVCVSLRFVSSGVFLWLLLGLIGSLNTHHPMPERLPEKQKEKNPFILGMIIFALVAIYRIFSKTYLPDQSPGSFDFLLTFITELAWIAPMSLIVWIFIEVVMKAFEERQCGLGKLSIRIIQILLLVVAFGFRNVFWGYFEADVNHNLAIMFSKQSNWIPALDYYNKVIKQNPSFIMAHYFMGNVYNDRWAEGDPERSIQKYRDVWALAPNYVQSHHQAGLIFLKWAEDEKRRADEARLKGDKKSEMEFEKARIKALYSALEEFERYRTIDPIFPLNYYRMHTVYRELNMPDKAEAILLEHLNFLERMQKPPYDIWKEDWTKRRLQEYSETCLNLGNFAFMRNDIKKAEGYYRKAVEFYPGAVNAWKNLAIIYSKQGKFQEASDFWNKVRMISPQDPDVQRVFKQK